MHFSGIFQGIKKKTLSLHGIFLWCIYNFISFVLYFFITHVLQKNIFNIMCLKVRDKSLIMGWRADRDTWNCVDHQDWPKYYHPEGSKNYDPRSPNLVMNSFKDITWPANRSARWGNNNVLLGHKWGPKMFEPQACCPHPIINEWSHQASLHPHKHVYIWIHIVNRVKILGGLDVG